MTLAKAIPGRYQIVDIQGGIQMNARLSSMGIMAGDIIDVTQGKPGPIFIAKGNSRIGIGRGMSSRIIIEPVEDRTG